MQDSIFTGLTGNFYHSYRIAVAPNGFHVHLRALSPTLPAYSDCETSCRKSLRPAVPRHQWSESSPPRTSRQSCIAPPVKPSRQHRQTPVDTHRTAAAMYLQSWAQSRSPTTGVPAQSKTAETRATQKERQVRASNSIPTPTRGAPRESRPTARIHEKHLPPREQIPETSRHRPRRVRHLSPTAPTQVPAQAMYSR